MIFLKSFKSDLSESFIKAGTAQCHDSQIWFGGAEKNSFYTVPDSENTDHSAVLSLFTFDFFFFFGSFSCKFSTSLSGTCVFTMTQKTACLNSWRLLSWHVTQSYTLPRPSFIFHVINLCPINILQLELTGVLGIDQYGAQSQFSFSVRI